jgi:hypothetical protein
MIRRLRRRFRAALRLLRRMLHREFGRRDRGEQELSAPTRPTPPLHFSPPPPPKKPPVCPAATTASAGSIEPGKDGAGSIEPGKVTVVTAFLGKIGGAIGADLSHLAPKQPLPSGLDPHHVVSIVQQLPEDLRSTALAEGLALAEVEYCRRLGQLVVQHRLRVRGVRVAIAG